MESSEHTASFLQLFWHFYAPDDIKRERKSLSKVLSDKIKRAMAHGVGGGGGGTGTPI